jgi:hypothetical protein
MKNFTKKYMLNYSLPCSCSKNLSSFGLTLKQQWTIKISSPLFLLLAWRPSWLESSNFCCSYMARSSLTYIFLWNFSFNRYIPIMQIRHIWIKLCPVIPTSNQDGRQARNRKKGGWNFKKIFSSETTEMTIAHVRGWRSCFVKVDFDFSLVKSKVQVAL